MVVADSIRHDRELHDFDLHRTGTESPGGQPEVLRDGAAAQYGSDAIAGVLNFLLKDDRSGGSVEVRGGTHGAGDGRQYAVAANAGLPLGRTGFANFSLEYGNTASTDRSVQRADAARLVAAGNRDVGDPAQQWGSPEVDDDLKLFANLGHLFANGVQAYGHAGYARRDALTFFYFRNPNPRGGVFSNDGGRTLLVGDVLAARGQGSADCPTVAVTGDVPDPAALRAVFGDPNCFSFQERFPGGFTPRFGGAARDASVVGGLRGQLASGVLWDASVTAGANTADFSIRNTVNASLGPETPTTFDVGRYGQREVGVDLDLSRAVNDRVHLAGGAEWRNERFLIGLGQPESWQQGPYAARGFSVGSNGTPGFGPLAAGTWNRANAAVYGDIELRGASRDWTVGTAARYEHFADFGATLNGKVSARVPLSGRLALRGSLGTGFRAPALLNPDRIADRIRLLEEALPDTRWSAGVDQAVGRGALLARLSYYGGWYDRRDAHRYRGQPMVDLELSWPPARRRRAGGRGPERPEHLSGREPQRGQAGQPLSALRPVRLQRRVLLHAARLPVARRLNGLAAGRLPASIASVSRWSSPRASRHRSAWTDRR